MDYKYCYLSPAGEESNLRVKTIFLVPCCDSYFFYFPLVNNLIMLDERE